MSKQDKHHAPTSASFTDTERDLVKVAIQELHDLTYWGTGDAADAGLEGLDLTEQIETTRETVAKAMKCVTKLRGREVRRTKVGS